MQLVRTNLTASELRNFGLITLGGFAVLSAVFWYLGADAGVMRWAGTGQQKAAVVLLCVGLMFAVVCAVSHRAGIRLYRGWMTIAMYLGTVVSTIVLSIMFIVFLPVFSLIRFKDPLRLKLGGVDSYWEDHAPHEATLERTARPF